MSDLEGLTILVVEDEFFVAVEIASALSESGAVIVGPAGSVEQAMEFLAENRRLDLAVLDVNLAGQMVFPVADVLLERGTPFLFVTGYDADVIPVRHRGATRLEKPAAPTQIIRAIIAATPKTQD